MGRAASKIAGVAGRAEAGAISTRERRPVFCRMRETWVCTVRGEMNSRVPISRLVSPSRTRAAIRVSVAVRAAQPKSASRCASRKPRRRPSARAYRTPGVGWFDAQAMGPRAACRRAGKRRRDPRRGAVGVAPSQVAIVSGATARHKLVEIQREDAFPPPAV